MRVEKSENLKYVLQLEYVDLKRTVYDELEEFFDGKLTYTLQHEYCPEEDEIDQFMAETIEAYEDIMNDFKEIVDVYLVD